MDLVTLKLLSAALLLVVGLVGGFLSAKVSQLSKLAVHVAYAFAGGILASVAVVHMLSDASEDLEPLGAKISKALGADEGSVFPLGNALFLVGFFFICSVEAFLHHKLGAHAQYDHSGHSQAEEGSDQGAEGAAELGAAPEAVLPEKREVAAEKREIAAAENAAGWATVVGLSIHSIVEGVAAGAVSDDTQAGFVILAIAAHKGFAAFANASANLPLKRSGQRCMWIALVTWFALTGPLGMIMGLAVSKEFDGTATAIVTALAAGTLLSVGVSEMLWPAFQDARGLGWKIFAATSSMLAMSLLAAWA